MSKQMLTHRAGETTAMYIGSGSIGSDIPGQEMRWNRTYLFWLDNKNVVYDWDMQKEEVPYSAMEAENL